MFHAKILLCLSKFLLVKDELQLTNAISKEKGKSMKDWWEFFKDTSERFG